MRIFPSVLILFILVLFANIITDKSIFYAGTEYNKTSLSNCLNDHRIYTEDSILIGTSVSRELTESPNHLILGSHKYFVCGVSAPITNLDFHFLILNLLDNKISISGKNILIEISTQGILNSSSIFEVESFERFLSIAPIATKIFWLKNYILAGNYSEKGNDGMLLTLKYIFFPSIVLNQLSFSETHSSRKNYYLEKIFTPKSAREDKLAMLRNELNSDMLFYRVQSVIDFVDSKEGSLGFLLPPTNSYHTLRTLKESTSTSIDEFFSELAKDVPVVDIRGLDNEEFFADCCHFNKSGQFALQEFLSRTSGAIRSE